jgi:hypothetical protein
VEIRSRSGDKMNWLFSEDSDHSHILVLIFEVANMTSAIILLLTTAVLLYFLKKKKRGISDHVVYVVTSAIFLLGIKKLITISIQKWAAYPAYCTLIDVSFAMTLLILIWLLPPLILKILATVSREQLLVDLVEETRSKLTAQDSAASLEIKNLELQTIIFKFDTILNIQDRSGNQIETVDQLRKVISSSGGSQ